MLLTWIKLATPGARSSSGTTDDNKLRYADIMLGSVECILNYIEFVILTDDTLITVVA